MGVKILQRYGYHNESRQLAERYLAHIAGRLSADGAYYENYHAETGAPLKAKGIASWYLLLPFIHEQSEDAFFPSLPAART